MSCHLCGADYNTAHKPQCKLVGRVASSIQCATVENKPMPAPIDKAIASITLEDDKTTQHRVLAFLNDLCHPDQYGHAVSREVRKRARELANDIEEELRQP